MERVYTHTDKNGVRWRFDAGRPISELADKIMDEVVMSSFGTKPVPKKKKKKVDKKNGQKEAG